MAPEGQRYYVKYTFYKALPEWYRLPKSEREEGAEALLRTVDSFGEGLFLRSYNLQGMRGDVDFMFWQVAPSLEEIQSLTVQLAGTSFGHHLTVPHSYHALTRRSTDVDAHRHAGQEGRNAGVTRPVGSRYLIVYPFWKTRPWYRLSQEERQAMMNVHFQIGHKYPTVKINTSYSFGLDDQEFVVAFETDEPGDFLDLVMELRETEGSLYTLRDTPIFTCISMDLKEILAGFTS
jgi:chlorite dismutase